MKRAAFLLAAACLSLLRVADGEVQGGAKMFERLRALAGEWEGSVEWSGARSDKGKMNATYYLTGAGSSVVENLTANGTTLMTSVYHLDGEDLRMTHFCAAQNQPRLKATRFDDAKGTIEFSFVDITNLPLPGAPHVEGFMIHFVEPGQIALTFTFVSGRERSYERIELRRASSKRVG
ncbi:MAG TPA: hypothetical protein VN461_08355 [Vicinamibacteria bacterium]|jgi:hypothetical protein|nr:hypothetical protein [Vicinamibacteria bacterium]